MLWNDTASSAGANGGACRYTRFYENGSQSGAYFTLYSATLEGSNYQDPYLSNGAGYDGAGVPWNDRVSSWWFTGC